MQMGTITCWIQRADFTTADHGVADAAAAAGLMRAHDWADEWQLFENRRADGLETCPPGAGFVKGDGAMLHVSPERDGRALVHYHFRERRRWLGLVPYEEQIVRTNGAVVSSQLPEFIRRFYDDDHLWLVNETEAT
jgi:hypothetical protein